MKINEVNYNTPIDNDMRGYSSASRTLQNKNLGNQPDSNEQDRKKKEVIRNVIKDKAKKIKGKNVFDPSPDISEKDTLIKT